MFTPSPQQILSDHHRTHHAQYVKIVRKSFHSAEDAEDVVMQAWSKAAASLHRYDAKRGEFGPWFAAILRQRVIEAIRQQKRALPTTAELHEDDAVCPDPSESILQRLDIASALQRLPERQQIVLRQCIMDGMTLAEYAAQNGISCAAAHARLKTAKAALRAIIEATGTTR